MKFIDQYPEQYRNDPLFTAIQESLQHQSEIDESEWDDLFNQFFINTATWGLYKWEQFAGLPISENLDNETRRGNILAALRSRTTSTVDRIRIIAESYANGECQIVEENDKYMFYIKFNGEKGIPKRLDELKKSVDNIKPAHLAFDFIFSYLSWNEFDKYNKTWNEWDALNLTWNELEVYSENGENGKDNNPPTISELKAVNITNNSIEITYKATDEKMDTLKHFITISSLCTDKDITKEITTATSGFKYNIINLKEGTDYTIKIKVEDEEGLSRSTMVQAKTTKPTPVNQPPTINNLRQINITENTITIEYSATDEDTTSLKHYLTVDGLYSNKLITPTGNYRYVIEGLTGGNTYNISVKVEDKEGLSATSEIISIVTPESPKVNQPPKVVGLKTTGATETTIDIEYEVGDENVDTVRHYLYVSGVWIGRNITNEATREGNTFKYTIPGLAKNVTYSIKIELNDGEFKGNASIEGKTNNGVAPPEPSGKTYGFKIDETNSGSYGAVSYIESNTTNSPIVGADLGAWKNEFPFNKIRPVFLKGGKVIGEMKETDYTRMADNTPVDDEGDVMIEFPRFYYKFERVGNYLEVRFSEVKKEGYECPPFMYKGQEKEHVYIGAFPASEINGKLKSLPNKTPVTNKGRDALRNLACANGVGYEQMTPYKLDLLKILAILIYKSLDTQRSLGVGPNLNLIKDQPTGATKYEGFMRGQTDVFSHVKFLGLENIWGAGMITLDGIEIKNRKLFINQTGHPNDGTTEVGTFTGMVGWNTSQGGYMSKAFGTNKSGFFPMEFAGSDHTYYTDDCYVESDNPDFTCYMGGDNTGGLYKNGLFYIQPFTDPANGGSGRLYFGRLTYTG